MKRFTIFLALMVTTCALYAQGTLTVTSVLSTPVTGITVITYDLEGPVLNYGIAVAVSFNNGLSYLPVPPAHLSGDLANVTPGTGKKITWNGAAGFPNRYSTETKVRLTATPDVFICGESTVTFMYNGSEVTYGIVVGANGTCWLDRNLGASRVANSSTDDQAYGDLFQWGRGDDGHQIRSPLSGTTWNLSGSDTPGHGNFILSNSNENWDWRSPQNDNLWQGVNGVNNPCPPGYRVPTSAEWDAERLSWAPNNNSTGAFASPLKLPVAGDRYYRNGSLDKVGSYGDYWSSTVDGLNSWYLWFGSGEADMGSSGQRADGHSVRCIKH